MRRNVTAHPDNVVIATGKSYWLLLMEKEEEEMLSSPRPSCHRYRKKATGYSKWKEKKCSAHLDHAVIPTGKKLQATLNGRRRRKTETAYPDRVIVAAGGQNLLVWVPLHVFYVLGMYRQHAGALKLLIIRHCMTDPQIIRC